jgi:two-component system response regulator YesN
VSPSPIRRLWLQILGTGRVFTRLSASYAVLVVAVAMTLSTGAYLYFQSRYNAELENLHRVLMENIERELQAQVVDQSRSLYMEAIDLLSPGQNYFGPDEQAANNADKLYQTHKQLTELVSRHYPLVDAVHLYYRGAKVLLSTTQGLKYESDDPDHNQGRRWLTDLGDRGESALWFEGDQELTHVQTYPLLSAPTEATVLVAIDFNPTEARHLLERFTSSNTGTTLLLNRDGTVVVATPEVPAWDNSESRSLAASPPGAFVTVDGKPSLVTAMAVAGTDWTLVNVAPLALLHQKGEGVFWVLMLISVGVVVLGLGFSLVLALRVYTPLGRLLSRVKDRMGTRAPTPDQGVEDEYRLIDDAFEGLAATLQSHRPVLEHEFVSRMLQGVPIDGAEYKDTLNLLQLPALPGRCRAACLRLLEGGWVTKYRLAEELSRRGGPLTLVTPLEGRDLGLVVDASDQGLLEVQAAQWVDLARELGGASVCLAFGSAADPTAGLGSSFSQARELVEGRFFHPETKVFFANDGADQGYQPLPDEALEALAEGFRVRDPQRVTLGLDRVLRFIRQPRVPAQRGRAELYRTTRAMAKAMTDAGATQAAAALRRLDELLEEAHDIDEWRSEVLALAAELFAQIEERTDDRNGLLVARVKAYVADHRGGELSLDRVSAAVGISPGYLSKLFKELTGKNFVSYVTDERLTEAERLLNTTRATVQEIGKLVGFNTPAYFILQFRTKFGVTPYEYRRKNDSLR